MQTCFMHNSKQIILLSLMKEQSINDLDKRTHARPDWTGLDSTARDLLHRAAHFLTSFWKSRHSARSLLDGGHCVEVAPALDGDGDLLPDVGQVLQVWEQGRRREFH